MKKIKKQTKYSIAYFFGLVLVLGLLQIFVFSDAERREISYSEFRNKISSGKVESIVFEKNRIIGKFKGENSSKTKISTAPSTPWRLRLKSVEEDVARQFEVVALPMQDYHLIEVLEKANVDYRGQIESNFIQNFLLNWALPLLVLALIWFGLVKKVGGGNVLTVGKSRAKIYADDEKHKVTFKDVAGIDEAIEEVSEIVDFLKNPSKYTKLGGKLPKGILLVGPPGTGKTLLGRAVAGEAGVPFFSMSGSDFVEMFVGVGAARARDLFSEAKAKAPCIIFIDEIDAIGKKRGNGANPGGGYEERENTLNQLLVEMDGFDANLGVVMMAATNRPDVLDPALLRPGRFDRQVMVDKPDLSGRAKIFEVHSRKVKLAENVDIQRLSAMTPGFAGAEIANVVNEAALLAARKDKEEVRMFEFEEAIERVVAGLQKKNKLINPKERNIIAYHESGHAIAGYFTPGADAVQKVSIIPRGFGALGYVLQMPLEDRYLMSRNELLGKIIGLLAGRAAEEIQFGEISTGASNDLERASQLARNMIVVYGMSDKVPNISLVQGGGQDFLSNGQSLVRRSEKLEQQIDEEVLEIINSCYQHAKKILFDKRELLDRMAQELLDKEVIGVAEIAELLGDPKLVHEGLYIENMQTYRPEHERIFSFSNGNSSSNNQ